MSDFLSFFRLNNIYHIFLIYLSADGHMDCLCVLVIVNKVAMYMGVRIFLWDPVFNSFVSIPRNEVVGSYGNYIFNFFVETPYWFPEWLYYFTFPLILYKGSSVSTFSQHLLFSVSFDSRSGSGSCLVVSDSLRPHGL